jgi:hypothetical protein
MRWAIYVCVAAVVSAVPFLHDVTCAGTGPMAQARERREETVASAVPSTLEPAGQNTQAPVLRTDDFELRDWLAFGSGCRARPTSPGDVTLESSEVSGVRGRHRIRFALPNYGIRATDSLFQTKAAFARECGLRLAIYPTAGKKLTDVAAEPVFRVNKPAGPRVRLRTRLFVGDTALFRFENWLPEELTLHEQEQRAFAQSEARPNALFEGQLCEQPRIVGLDLSTAVVRENLTHYDVTVAPDHDSVEILLQFSACDPPTYTQRTGSRDMVSVEERENEQETK